MATVYKLLDSSMIEAFFCKIVAELPFYQLPGKGGRARAGGGIADFQAQFHVEPLPIQAAAARAAIDCPCRRTGRAMSAMPSQSRGCCCSSVCAAMSGRVRLFIVLGSAVLNI